MDKWNEISTGGWGISWRVIIGYCKNKKKKQLLCPRQFFLDRVFNFLFHPGSTRCRASSWREGERDMFEFREPRFSCSCHDTRTVTVRSGKKREENWIVRVKIGHCFFLLRERNWKPPFLCLLRYLNLLCFLIRLFNLKHFVFVLLLTIILRKKRNLKVILNSCMQLFLIN